MRLPKIYIQAIRIFFSRNICWIQLYNFLSLKKQLTQQRLRMTHQFGFLYIYECHLWTREIEFALLSSITALWAFVSICWSVCHNSLGSYTPARCISITDLLPVQSLPTWIWRPRLQDTLRWGPWKRDIIKIRLKMACQN